MQNAQQPYEGTCHCGKVAFQLEADLCTALRCNCSLCKRRGAVMLAAVEGSFKLLRGEAVLRVYQFNTNTAEHYFCSHCGIYTHHKPRSNPKIYRVNIGCLDGIVPFSVEAAINDGASYSSVPLMPS